MPEMQGSANFIPDNPVAPPSAGDNSGDSKLGGIADVVMLVSIVLLASSLAIATGVFLYGRLVDAQLNRAKTSLDRVRNNFDKNTIETLKLLSKRMVAGQDILNKHIAVSEVFKALENITLKSVQFKEFKFDYANPETIQIQLKGIALTVNAVAAQSKAFAANQDKFQNVIFSNLGFEKDGTVSFNVLADVNPDFINFTNLVLNQINSGSLIPTGANNANVDIQANTFNNNAPVNQGQNTLENIRRGGQRSAPRTQQASPDNKVDDTQQLDEFGIPINE